MAKYPALSPMLVINELTADADLGIGLVTTFVGVVVGLVVLSLVVLSIVTDPDRV